MTTARQRAERCFALARSTTFEAEREAAVGRGVAICEREGLDPDSFDIPGRAKAGRAEPPPASRYSDDLFAKPRAPHYYSDDELADTLRRFGEAMRRAAAAAGARSDETPYEARRRNFDEAARSARQRDELTRAAKAGATLWRLGTQCYPEPDRAVWVVQLKEGLAEVSPGELIELARVAEDRERLDALKRQGEAGKGVCPICKRPAPESRRGAPCYACVEPHPYSRFHEYGTRGK